MTKYKQIDLKFALFIKLIKLTKQKRNLQMTKLTSLAISKMLQDDAEDQHMIVQVFDIFTTKNGRIICSVSDGEYFTKGYLNDDLVIKPGQDQFSIVAIKSHGKMKNNIGITNIKFVGKYPQKLGEPLEWASLKQNAMEIKSNKQFKLEKMQKNEKILKTEPKKIELPTATKTASKNSQYQSIDDLHVGLIRWTILCRLTRKAFKQSSKKGTKVLQIELVDKSKKKIIGTFFADAAIEFNDSLKQDSIYEISKGRIIEGNYNNSKNDKLSSFALTFDIKSQFNEVCDVNIISKSEDSAITLGNLYNRRTLNQQFDVVAYVLEVKPQVTYQKNDRDLKIRQVVLADPEAKVTMSANLWRWNQQFREDMVGKVVIFSRFILKQSKNGLNLNSSLRASLIINHGHSMKKYQDRRIDVLDFVAATQHRQKVDENTQDFCTNSIELDSKIRRMATGETIKSILYVWISRFAYLKKWNYDSCPKCKKAAQKYSKCNNCGNPIEQTQLSFLMGIEVSDFCGSIWITMYDDLAKKIFYDMGNTAAKQLQQLSKDQLNQKLENYAYQPLKLKIITKKDQEGRLRHNAGRIFQLQQQRTARQNLKKIYHLMGKNQ